MITLKDYADRYANLKIGRSDDGILTVTMHTNGGSHVHSGQAHEDFGEAFAFIGQDPKNEVIIFTGAGDDYMTQIDFSTVVDNTKPLNWYKILNEARRMCFNLLDVQVPVIAAVNGPVHIHTEYPLLCDIVLASDTAEFADRVHKAVGVVPADGVQVAWEQALGPIRARYFLITGQVLSAQEALRLGVVNEVIPKAHLLERAQQLARELLLLPRLTRVYTHLMFTKKLKRDIVEHMPFDMGLEGAVLTDRNFNPWQPAS